MFGTSLSVSDRVPTRWQKLGHDRGCAPLSPHGPCYNQCCINEVTNSDFCFGGGFSQGISIQMLSQGHFWQRGVENPVFLKSIQKSQKLSLTGLPK